VLNGGLCETAGRGEVSAGALGVAVKSADAPHATRFGPAGARVVSINLEWLADEDWSIPRWCWARGAELQDELRTVVAAVIEQRSAPRPRDTLDGPRRISDRPGATQSAVDADGSSGAR